jgi:hypothetical protein
MYGAGPDVFALWGYVIAHTVDSQVELNPVYLAPLLGMPTDRVQAAINYLCQPDPKSRTKIEEGRRLVREGEYAYRVPTHTQYRRCRDERDRREYMREYQRKRRASRSPHPNGSTPSAKPQSHRYGTYEHVTLTDAQFQQLTTELGEAERDHWIQKVDDYCEQTGKRYKNYMVTINKWMKKEPAAPAPVKLRAPDPLPILTPISDEERKEAASNARRVSELVRGIGK